MTLREKDAKVQLRIALEELEQWRAAAKAADMTLSMWIRRAARAAIRPKRTPRR
jgi:hypothetical protein